MITLKRIMLLSFTAMFALIFSTQVVASSSYVVQSHRKEAAMSNSNGKITAPVSLTSDVYPVLGLSVQGRYDVGYACRNEHGKINPYAKYKPVKWSREYDGGIFKDLHIDDNWRGEDGHCGFEIPVYDSFNELENAIVNGAKINPPTVISVGYPFRLTDFNGYNHYAPRGFIYSVDIESKHIINLNNELYFSVELPREYDQNADYLMIQDLQVENINGARINFDEMYVGALFYNNSSKFTLVSDKTIGESGSLIEFRSNLSDRFIDRTYTLYIFYCESKNFDIDTAFVPSDVPAKKVKFLSPSSDMEVNVEFNGISDKIYASFTITIKNGNTNIFPCNGIGAYLYYANRTNDEELLASETIATAFTLGRDEEKVFEKDDFLWDFDNDGEQEYELSIKIYSTTSNSIENRVFFTYP